MQSVTYSSAKVAAACVGNSVSRYRATSLSFRSALCTATDDLPMTRPATPQEPSAKAHVVINSAARTATCVRRPCAGSRPPGRGTSNPASAAVRAGASDRDVVEAVVAGAPEAKDADVEADRAGSDGAVVLPRPCLRPSRSAFFCSYAALRTAFLASCSALRRSFFDSPAGWSARGGRTGTAASPGGTLPGRTVRTQAAATCARAASEDCCWDARVLSG